MIIQRQEDVTKAVTEAFKNTQPPRLREILISLVEHLHAFAREVELTEEEWLPESTSSRALGRRAPRNVKSSFCCRTRSVCRSWWLLKMAFE